MARGSRLKASPSSKEQAEAKDAQVEESQSAEQDRPVPSTRSRKRAAETGLEARPAKMPAVQIAKRITKVQGTAVDSAVMTRGRAAKTVAPSSHPAAKPAKHVSQAPRRRKRRSRVQIKAGKRKPVRAHGLHKGDQSADRAATGSSAHSDATDGETEEQGQTDDAPELKVAVVHRRRRGPNSAPKKSTPPAESAAGTGSSLPAPRHRRRRRKKPKPPVDDLSRIKNRVRNLIFRLRREQHLLDAYSSEGWKGQSREKLRPERELERAESQILQCKLAIREAIKELDVLSLEGSIDESAFDAEGQIFHEEIFCAICKSQEALADNDIILCDGFCNRGFHQKCLEPPLATDDIPPGIEGWLCPACEAKADSLQHINDELGTNFGVENSWEEVFREAAAAAAGEGTVSSANGDWPSEDDEDDDFDPEEAEKELSEDNDELEEGSHSSNDSGDSDSSENDAAEGRPEEHSSASDAEENMTVASGAEQHDDVAGGAEPPARKRSRKTVDYRRLNDEMFGGKSEADDDQHSEDEDWGPQRKRRPRKGSDDKKGRADYVADLNHGPSKVVEASDIEGADVRQAPACQEKRKRVVVRLPAVAIEVMRRTFAVNELPSRASKDDLAKELGLCYRQVDQWFKNMRYHALKNGLSTSSRPRTVDVRGSGKAAVQDTSSHDDRRSSLLGDGQLLQRLDEVEMKLHELKRTLDMEQASRNTALNASSPNSGKRIVYVPVAEVVEEAVEEGQESSE